MAKLGVRSVDELVGRTDLLAQKENLTPAQKKIDISGILGNPYAGKPGSIFDPKKVYDFALEKTLDEKVLLKQMTKAMENGQKRSIEVDVANTDRAFGTILVLRSQENSEPHWRMIPTAFCARAQADRASALSFPRA